VVDLSPLPPHPTFWSEVLDPLRFPNAVIMSDPFKAASRFLAVSPTPKVLFPLPRFAPSSDHKYTIDRHFFSHPPFLLVPFPPATSIRRPQLRPPHVIPCLSPPPHIVTSLTTRCSFKLEVFSLFHLPRVVFDRALSAPYTSNPLSFRLSST